MHKLIRKFIHVILLTVFTVSISFVFFPGCGDETVDKIDVQIPEIPTGLRASPGNGEVTLYWDTEADTSYNIYRSELEGVTKESGTLIPNVSSPYTDSDKIENDNIYYYVITAFNSSGESGESNEVSAMPVSVAPFSVAISPGDGTFVNMCPDTTIFTATVKGGVSPYTYSWVDEATSGAGFDITGSLENDTLVVCAWDSMTEGTIEVTVTDSGGNVTTDLINISW